MAKKSLQPAILEFKFVDFGVNRKSIWNYVYLLVINANVGPISRRFRDTAETKSPIFPTPSHLAPSVEVAPFWTSEKFYVAWN